MKLISQEKDVKLVMWERTMMPVRVKNPETGAWDATGEKEERTTYTFKDEFGDKLVLMSNDQWRELEGRNCIVTLGIAYNDYDKKTKVSLQSVQLDD